ncbi:MAG: CheR family methyltransferase [Thermoanaerobaculia bacterium]
MREAECVAFLQWALPKLGMRWAGFRKPRRQVCRRIRRRIEALGLEGFSEYRRALAEEPRGDGEWLVLDSLCRVTISRFLRDRAIWDLLDREVLPLLAGEAASARRTVLRAWSAGCASGEEPYSLGLVWRLGGGERSGTELEIVATDTDGRLLERAVRAVYPHDSLREVPPEWRSEAFRPAADGELELRSTFRKGVEFDGADIREESPEGPFDLVLCRNLAWTYFDEATQLEVLVRIRSVLRRGGCLVIGSHEELPDGGERLESVGRSVFQFILD